MKKQYLCSIVSGRPSRTIFQVIVDRCDDESLSTVELKAKKVVQEFHVVDEWGASIEAPLLIAEIEQGKYPSGSISIIGELVEDNEDTEAYKMAMEILDPKPKRRSRSKGKLKFKSNR
jgi:hypothetical protein